MSGHGSRTEPRTFDVARIELEVKCGLDTAFFGGSIHPVDRVDLRRGSSRSAEEEGLCEEKGPGDSVTGDQSVAPGPSVLMGFRAATRVEPAWSPSGQAPHGSCVYSE